MSPPWIIWCRQRTGSIALSEALRDVTPHKLAELEPFDDSVEKRQFGHIPHLGEESQRRELNKICKEGWCLKHCYDRLPLGFNLELAAATNQAGYRHVHLVRRNELARLISLGVAENEVTWLAKSELTTRAFDEIRSGRRKMKPLDVESLVERSNTAKFIWKQIEAHLARCKNIWTEDVVSPNRAQRESVLTELLVHLGLPRNSLAVVEKKLEGSGQNTFSLWRFVPNINELRRALNP